MERPLPDVLRAAVERGLITSAQESALLGLAGERPPRTPGEYPSIEAPRGFNWVTVAYALGALLVVFACVYFLAERWRALGAGGVFAVSLAYASGFALLNRWFERSGFREAAGVAAMLSVAMTPAAVWAAQTLSGWWPEGTWGMPYRPYLPAEYPRWVVLEFATIGVALAVFRRTRYVALTLPLAAATWGIGYTLPQAFAVETAPTLERWAMLTAALLVIAVADLVDRRQPARGATASRTGDYAFAFWLVGLIGLGASLLAFWPMSPYVRHGSPVLALALVAAGLVLRRRTHLVFGVLVASLYLMYLAAEVFRNQALFPVVLALLGGLLIAATVWTQRRFPDVAARIEARRGADRRGLPGATWIPFSLAAVAFIGTILRYPDAAAEVEAREFRDRLQVTRQRSGSVPRAGRSGRAATPLLREGAPQSAAPRPSAPPDSR